MIGALSATTVGRAIVALSEAHAIAPSHPPI
jgi:hypothetical protein